MSSLENKRQFFHMLAGLLVVFLLYFGILNWIIILAMLVICGIFALISKKVRVPILSWFLDTFERKKDMKTFPLKGTFFGLLGTFFALILFRDDIAMAAIMILVLGDSVGPLVGQFGKVKHPFSDMKFLEGMVAGIIAGFIGAVAFVSPVEALLASAAAMIVEGIELKLGADRVDDNIVMPVVAGVVILWVRAIL